MDMNSDLIDNNTIKLQQPKFFSDSITKRVLDNLDFDYIVCFDSLLKAFKKCRRGVSWKKRVQDIKMNYGEILFQVCDELKNGTYEHHEQYQFVVCERGKERLIDCVHILDRIIEKSLCDNFIVPVLSEGFIYNNTASQKDKGTDFARENFKKELQSAWDVYGEDGYILHFDVKKFFHETKSDIVFDRIVKYLSQAKLNAKQQEELLKILELLKFYICNKPTITLGNQSSQLAAVFILSELDHYCKDVCRIKYYGRYMDDGYVILPNKQQAIDFKSTINELLARVGLECHEKKTFIEPLSNMCIRSDGKTKYKRRKQYPNGGVMFLKRKFCLNKYGDVEMYALQHCVRRTIKKNKNKKRISQGVDETVLLQRVQNFINNKTNYQYMLSEIECNDQIVNSSSHYLRCKNFNQIKREILDKSNIIRTNTEQ